MKKILLALIIIASFIIPVFPIGNNAGADTDKFAHAINVETRLGDNSVTKYTGIHSTDKNGVTQYQYEATIYPYPIYTEDNSPIDLSWYSDKGKYYGGNNLYEASVEGSKTLVTYEGETLYWDPIVIVGKDEYTSVDSIIDTGLNRKSESTSNILTWNYGICSRVLTLGYGSIKEEYIFNSDPGGDIQIVSNQHASEGFIYIDPPYAYDADMQSIPITQDKYISYKDLEGVKYPITIDPSANFNALSSSGFGGVQGDTWQLSHDASAADSIGSGFGYFRIASEDNAYWLAVYRGYFYFTVSLPSSAVMMSANLSLTVNQINFGLGGSCTVHVTGGMPTYPHNPLVIGDFLYTQYSMVDYGSLTISSTGTKNISLNAAGLSNISKTTTTKFVVMANTDFHNTPPAFGALEDFSICTGSKLIITYSASAVPTVTTQAETSIGTDSVTLNGYLDNDNGNESCLWRFSYGTSSGSYGTSTTWTGAIKTGDSFNKGITGLTSNTMYYYRAEVQNDIGQGNGSERSFRTVTVLSFSAPTMLFASSESGSEILLTWSAGYATYGTMLRYKTGAYPSGTGDGTQIYNGPLTSYEHTGLTPGTTYYYRAWGVDSVGNYTTNYAQVLETTPVTSTTNTSVTLPVNSWYNPLSNSSVSNLPFASLVRDAAASAGMSEVSLWLILALCISLMFGTFAYVMTGSVTITILVMMFSLAGGVSALVIPFWVVFMFGVIGFGSMILVGGD